MIVQENNIISYETTDITPEVASQWLMKNIDNRKPSKAKIRKLAIDLKEQNWVANADAVRFNRNDVLIDGQHRLMAVVESGVTIKNALVARGLSEKAYITIDDGIPRQMHQFLAHANLGTERRQKVLAYLIANMCSIEKEGSLAGIKHHKQITKSQMNKWIKLHETEAVDAVIKSYIAQDAIPFGSPSTGTKSWAVAIYLSTQLHGDHTVDDFLTGLINGNENPEDPRNVLRHWMIKQNSDHDKNKQRSLRKNLTAFNKCFNAYVLKQDMKRIRLSRSEALPELVVLEAS